MDIRNAFFFFYRGLGKRKCLGRDIRYGISPNEVENVVGI